MAQAQPPQALRYDLDIRKFLTFDSLQAIGVELSNFHDVRVRILHKHPFPAPDFAAAITAKNRADLGYTGRLFLLADTTNQNLGSGIKVDPVTVRDPDGYASPGDLLSIPGLTNTHFPYILLADEAKNNRLGVSNGGIDTGNYEAASGGWQRVNAGPGNNDWTGFDYIHQGQSVVNEFTLDRESLEAADWTIKAALVIQYTDPRGTAGKVARMPFEPVEVLQFAYRMPYASLDVSRLPCDCEHRLLIPDAGAIVQITGSSRDWDASSAASSDIDLSDEPNVALNQPGGPGTPSVTLVLPDLYADPIQVPSSGGSGFATDEFELGVTIENELGATPRDHWGYLRAADPELDAPDRGEYHFGVDWSTLTPDPARALTPETIFPIKVTVPPATTAWAMTWGDFRSEHVTRIAFDESDGDIYVAGWFLGEGVDVEPGDCRVELPVAGDSDVYMTKLDVNGQRVWSGVFGGSDFEYPIDLQVDLLGQPVLLLDTRSLDCDINPLEDVITTVPNSGGFVPVLVKLDSDSPDIDWFRAWGPYADFSNAAGFSSLRRGHDSSAMYIGGNFQGTVDLNPEAGVDERTSADPRPDAFLLKVGNSASYEWARTWGDPGGSPDGIFSVLGVDGGVVVAGVVQDSTFSGSVDLNPEAGTDPWPSHHLGSPMLVKLDTTGAYQWGRAWLLDDVDDETRDAWGAGFRLAADSVGNIALFGTYAGLGDFDPGPAEFLLDNPGGMPRAYISDFDPDGNFRWAFDYSDVTFAPESAHLWIGPDDQVWLGGHFNGAADFDPGPGTVPYTATVAGWPFAVAFSGTDGTYAVARVWEQDDAYFHGFIPLPGDRTLIGLVFGGDYDVDPGAGTLQLHSNGETDVAVLNLSGDVDWD